MSTGRPLYFPAIGKLPNSSAQISHNHFLLLRHLLEADVEKTVSDFYNQSISQNLDFPNATLCENPYIVCTIADGEKNFFPDKEPYPDLKQILTASFYNNLAYLLRGNQHRFIWQLYLGIVTQKESTNEPFIWEGPSKFTIYNQGLIVTIKPKGVYVSGTGIKPKLLKQNTGTSLLAELNKALTNLKKQ